MSEHAEEVFRSGLRKKTLKLSFPVRKMFLQEHCIRPEHIRVEFRALESCGAL